MLHSTIGNVETRDGEIVIVTSVGDAGCVVYGPYSALEPGNYEVEFHVMPHDLSEEVCCVVDILRRGSSIVTERDFTGRELIHRNGVAKVRFEVVAHDTFEFRLTATGRAALTVRYKRPLRTVGAIRRSA